LINQLATDPKELAENIMIVDLVRNDLSKLATKASVKVDELCRIYTFEQVHQMISTISCELKPNIDFTSILEATFPMGSMTGAPKIEAMKLAEAYETTKRGLYSGSIGYITPNGDFDFNVVIRSLLYNAKRAYLSYMVGSAITDQSIPENEYQECLLKGKALQEIFCKA
ncbi:MAG: chorismate-binding protein, partial [Psychroflexus salarius]